MIIARGAVGSRHTWSSYCCACWWSDSSTAHFVDEPWIFLAFLLGREGPAGRFFVFVGLFLVLDLVLVGRTGLGLALVCCYIYISFDLAFEGRFGNEFIGDELLCQVVGAWDKQQGDQAVRGSRLVNSMKGGRTKTTPPPLSWEGLGMRAYFFPCRRSRATAACVC